MPDAREAYRLPRNRKELLASFHHAPDPDSFHIAGGLGNPKLTRDVAKWLGKEADIASDSWADGEPNIQLGDNVRGREVIIFNSLAPNMRRDFADTLFMVRAARLASARSVSVVNPYFPGRQDRKPVPRTNITAADVADHIVHAGANKILTADQHAEQTVGAVVYAGVPWDIVYGSKVLVPAIKRHKLRDLTVVAPDTGSTKRTKKYREMLGAENMAIVLKDRDLHTNGTDSYALIGDVKNGNAIICDDEIASGSTMEGAARMLKEQGVKKVYAAATHGKLLRDKNGRTMADRMHLPDHPIDRLIITDTIEQDGDIYNNSKVEVVTMAPVLAVALMCWLTDESLSAKLIER